MAVTEAELCNLALSRVGSRVILNSLDESNVEARTCKVHYPTTRNALLELYAWPFAEREAYLSAISGATRFGWGFVYALPADCLAPRYIFTGSRNPFPASPIAPAWPGTTAVPAQGRVPFSIADGNADATGRILKTDATPCPLVYTAKITSVALFSDTFVEALSWWLASELFGALPIKPQTALTAAQMFQRAQYIAQASAARQQTEAQPPPSSFVSGRS